MMRAWPSPYAVLGINLTALMTFLLICSSVTMVLAHAAAVEGKQKELVRYLARYEQTPSWLTVGQVVDLASIAAHHDAAELSFQPIRPTRVPLDEGDLVAPLE